MDNCIGVLVLIVLVEMFILGIVLGVTLASESRPSNNPTRNIHLAGVKARQKLDRISDEFLSEIFREGQEQIKNQQEERQ